MSKKEKKMMKGCDCSEQSRLAEDHAKNLHKIGGKTRDPLNDIIKTIRILIRVAGGNPNQVIDQELSTESESILERFRSQVEEVEAGADKCDCTTTTSHLNWLHNVGVQELSHVSTRSDTITRLLDVLADAMGPRPPQSN